MPKALVDFDLERAHIGLDRDASSKRPGFQSNLSDGTHMGVRNLAAKHVGRKECLMEVPAMLMTAAALSTPAAAIDTRTAIRICDANPNSVFRRNSYAAHAGEWNGVQRVATV